MILHLDLNQKRPAKMLVSFFGFGGMAPILLTVNCLNRKLFDLQYLEFYLAAGCFRFDHIASLVI